MRAISRGKTVGRLNSSTEAPTLWSRGAFDLFISGPFFSAKFVYTQCV